MRTMKEIEAEMLALPADGLHETDEKQIALLREAAQVIAEPVRKLLAGCRYEQELDSHVITNAALVADLQAAHGALGAASRASPEAPPKLHEVPPMHGFPGHDCATMPCYVVTLREYAKITAPYRREIDRLRGKVAGRASPEEGRGDQEDEITRRLKARFRDGVEAAARILAGQGIDCRGILDIRDADTLKEIEETLAKLPAPPTEDERARARISGIPREATHTICPACMRPVSDHKDGRWGRHCKNPGAAEGGRAP